MYVYTFTDENSHVYSFLSLNLINFGIEFIIKVLDFDESVLVLFPTTLIQTIAFNKVVDSITTMRIK